MSCKFAKGVFIVAAKRTPFGAYGGKLKDKTITDLAEIAARATIAAANVRPDAVQHVIFGNVAPTSTDSPYLARHAALRVGIPKEVPAFSVNRLCGSGFQAVVSGAMEISAGACEVALVGGSENMSISPFVLNGLARFGTRLGLNLTLEDSLWTTLTDQQAKAPMGITAENLAEQHKITRAQCDEFTLRSQTRWKKAYEAGHFKAETVGVKIKGKKGEELFERDEHPRDTSLEALGKLPTVFKKDGVVTAGGSSGICDGAAALLLVGESALSRLQCRPLCRVVGYAVVGCEPRIMGIGPVGAIRKLLATTERTAESIDLYEVNEAFAAQYLAVEKVLGLPPDRTNVNGGALALGHPVGASGARITGHLAHELVRTKQRYAIGSACIGGGQGIALLLENVTN